MHIRLQENNEKIDNCSPADDRNNSKSETSSTAWHTKHYGQWTTKEKEQAHKQPTNDRAQGVRLDNEKTTLPKQPTPSRHAKLQPKIAKHSVNAAVRDKQARFRIFEGHSSGKPLRAGALKDSAKRTKTNRQQSLTLQVTETNTCQHTANYGQKGGNAKHSKLPHKTTIRVQQPTRTTPATNKNNSRQDQTTSTTQRHKHEQLWPWRACLTQMRRKRDALTGTQTLRQQKQKHPKPYKTQRVTRKAKHMQTYLLFQWIQV